MIERKVDALLATVGLVIFAIIYGLIEAEVIGPFWKLNIIIICINVIMSVSLNLINGYTGQFSLGHAGFMAVGAYVSVVLTAKLQLPFGLAILAAAVAAGFVGFLIGIPTLRLNGDYLAIATLGLCEIIRIVIMNIDYVGGAAGFTGIPRYTTFAWAFLVMLATLLFIKNFVNSAYGRACIAIRENEIAAEAMGVKVVNYKVLAFTLGRPLPGRPGRSLPTASISLCRAHSAFSSPSTIL